MKFSNFTTDIAYLVFSILQFLLTVFALIWVNYIIRNKDKKDEKERLEKEERDKIADIIDNEYNKIVKDGIVDKLKECKAKFQAMMMFHGSVPETRGRKYKITGLDILRYKLLNLNDSEMSKGMPLEKLQQDLDAVMRLFMSLRIKLPLKGECPENIREELGPLIIDIGEIAGSFVLASKRYTIAHVMKYFGDGQAATSKRTEEMKDDDDNRKTRRIFPYLNNLTLAERISRSFYDFPNIELQSYHDQDFDCNIFLTPGLVRQETNERTLKNLEFAKYALRFNKDKTINYKVEDLRRFANKIDAIWKRKFPHLPKPDWSAREDLHGNVRHAVLVFIFEVAKGNDIINDGEFEELAEEMGSSIYVGESEMQKARSDWMLRKIHDLVEMLRTTQSHLCEQKSLADMLEQVHRDLNTSIEQANRKAQREANSQYL